MSNFDFNARRLLFDTNVLLDAIDKNRPQCAEAREVLRICNGGGDVGFATPMAMSDAYYILSRQHGPAWARAAVNHLMGLVIVGPCSAEECDLSLRSDEPDFEDGLVRAFAELNDIDFILTRDKDAFAHSKVRSLTCREFLDTVACLD